MMLQQKAGPFQATPHFADYLTILLKHKLVIFAAFTLTCFITALLVARSKPLYESASRLIIDSEREHSPVTGVPVDFVSQEIDLATHSEVIKSRPVLETALQQLEKNQAHSSPSEPIAKTSTFIDNPVWSLLSRVRMNLEHFAFELLGAAEGEKPPFSESEILDSRISALRSSIKVEQVQSTRLISISVQSTSPAAARDTANAIANAYILYDSSSRLEGSRKMIDWLGNQLYEMKKNVEETEVNFLRFKQRENVFSLEGKQKINVEKIEDMNKAYIDAKTTRLELEARIEELKKFVNRAGAANGVPSFYKESQAHGLYSELLAAEVEYRRISQLYKGKHPDVMRLSSKIEDLRSKISSELQRAIKNAESERAILLARESALQQAMNGFEKDAIDGNRKEVEYAILEREVNTNKQIYDALLKKIKETDLLFGEALRAKLRIIEPASLPTSPITANKVRSLAMGMIVGLLTGMGMAFLLEYMDRTFHTVEKVEKHLALPVLSEIPLEEKKVLFARLHRQNGDKPFPSVLTVPMHSHFSESFRGLATNLRFSEFNRHKGVYLITSSSPKEGKTTVSLNLGMTLANLGLKTVVVEADLRLPNTLKMLGLKTHIGLTNILVNSFGTEIRSGSIGELSFGDVHFLLSLQEKTGDLHYHTDKGAFIVEFQNGHIANVSRPKQPDEHRLLYLLGRTGRLNDDHIDIVLEEERLTSRPIEDIILDLRLLTLQELEGPLRLMIRENIQELQSCREAQFHFVEDKHHSSGRGHVGEASLKFAHGFMDEIIRKETPFLSKEVNRHLCYVPDVDFSLLPCGRIPPNPVELLMSNRMRALVQLLREQFDIVLVDSPPVANLSDARVLAPLCDGIILVIKAGQTTSDVIQRVQKQLVTVQAPIIGTVLNMFNYRKDPYYYGRYYHKRYYKDNPEESESGVKA
jgi:polysaccharide biosynthesis transport protein